MNGFLLGGEIVLYIYIVYIYIYSIGGDFPLLSRLEYSDHSLRLN